MTREPATIHTLLFDREGRPQTGEYRSYYDAGSAQVDLAFGIITSQEMHVVIVNGDWIVVSRCYSASQPFYVHDRIVPSLEAGIQYINSQLPKVGVTPAPYDSPR